MDAIERKASLCIDRPIESDKARNQRIPDKSLLKGGGDISSAYRSVPLLSCFQFFSLAPAGESILLFAPFLPVVTEKEEEEEEQVYIPWKLES